MNESAPTMTELKTLVDTASTQSDRWLFIALLAIGMCAIWMFAKYFIAELKTRDVKYDELNKFVRDDLSQLVNKCTSALEANTQVIERLSKRRDDNGDFTFEARKPGSHS
jgi:hypothetical protein